MTTSFNIQDPGDTKIKAKVDPSEALCIIENPFPPLDVAGGMRVFRQYFTDDGTASGSNDMAVDGSTPQDFYIPTSQTADRYICTISFLLTEPSMSLNEWANTGSALSNGVRFFYEDSKGEVDIHDAIKTNFDLIRLCLGQPSFGSGQTVFRATNVLGTDEGYLPFLDMRQVFGFRWGVKLTKGSTQRIVIRIRDNITSTDGFDAIAYGFDREE